MTAHRKLADAVRSVLKTEARNGSTTKNGATTLVLKRIEGLGGPGAYGIGAAAIRLALSHIIGVEISRQFKMPLSDHAQQFILPKTVPVEIVSAWGRIPSWIALEEGKDALWMNSLKATVDHWLANASLKEKKARETMDKANFSLEIANYLQKYNCKSLGEVLGE